MILFSNCQRLFKLLSDNLFAHDGLFVGARTEAYQLRSGGYDGVYLAQPFQPQLDKDSMIQGLSDSPKVSF